MPEQAVKIYNDGGHFIGIRKGAYPTPKKKSKIKPMEEEIVLKEETLSLVSEDTNTAISEEEPITVNNLENTSITMPTAKRKTTRKELFETLYKKILFVKALGT